MIQFFASIPSPGRGVLYLGPLPIRAYGLMLALGVGPAPDLLVATVSGKDKHHGLRFGGYDKATQICMFLA